MLSNNLEDLFDLLNSPLTSNSASTSNPTLAPNPSLALNPTLASNPWDPNVTEFQTSNFVALSSLPNITAETPQAPSIVPCIKQASAMTLSPSGTQVHLNEQLEVQEPCYNQFEARAVTDPPAPVVKKSVKMRVGSSNTPRQAIMPPFSIFCLKLSSYFRGLCSIDWCANNPGGTVAEFKVFYNNLHPAELKVREWCFFLFLWLSRAHAFHQRYEDLAKANRVSLPLLQVFFFAECENFRKLVNYITNQSVISIIMPVLSRIYSI
jgi:hypothetical protein